MIFVTIGSMFPFDRLIRAMDQWTAQTGQAEVFAQIGNGDYEPQHMEYVRTLPQAEFTATMARAELIVAHCGMGTVITAGQAGRPMVLVPRQKTLNEVTSNHQQATARWLGDKPGVFIAETEADLAITIARAQNTGSANSAGFAATADAAFITRLRDAILDPTQGKQP